jgi:hypothetical protein
MLRKERNPPPLVSSIKMYFPEFTSCCQSFVSYSIFFAVDAI